MIMFLTASKTILPSNGFPVKVFTISFSSFDSIVPLEMISTLLMRGLNR